MCLGDSVVCGCGWQCGGCDWLTGRVEGVCGCGYESDRYD